jgi:hypothetical protein
VKKRKKIVLDFVIDKLTNSIENRFSGDSFQTEISVLTKADLKKLFKKDGWQFDWKFELAQPERDVYKLTIIDNQNVIQGLVSLQVKADSVYMHLIESAPFNRGRTKIYIGVPGNLVAYACKLSFQRGNEGFVSFLAKTNLINHYEKDLGATHFGGGLMVIDTITALKLTDKYFKKD